MTQEKDVLAAQVAAAATTHGLSILASEVGRDFSGNPTTRFTLALASDPAKSEVLELSDTFNFAAQDLLDDITIYLAESARRLQNPRPDCYVTLHGLPLSFRGFAWPFHTSTTGADTLLVHGEVHLEDGQQTPLHAKISAAMTLTFAEIVRAPEQPFAESFIFNAVRKTFDQGQLELVKSGNRQPVPVTTRYYSRWQKKFTFNDTTPRQRHEFLASKTFWLSGILGSSQPVWLADPRDAQYLNTSVDELQRDIAALASEGLIRLATDTEFATPTDALMGLAPQYHTQLAEALAFLKPTFNEDMRAGHTNM